MGGFEFCNPVIRDISDIIAISTLLDASGAGDIFNVPDGSYIRSISSIRNTPNSTYSPIVRHAFDISIFSISYVRNVILIRIISNTNYRSAVFRTATIPKYCIPAFCCLNSALQSIHSRYYSASPARRLCRRTPQPSSDGTTTAATPTQSATALAPNGTLEVHFINVGQSVSTLVVGPTGETMLIDTGHFRNDGEYVLQHLQRHNVERIDYLVTSHNDADHIGGHADVIEYYETEADGIGAIYDPGIAASTQTYEAYLDAVEAHKVMLYETREGDAIPFEAVDVQVFGPPEPYLEGEARNENSIVLKLSFGQTSFLFTGDAEDDQEVQLVDTYGDQLRATVMKAGHHGSQSSTSAMLLDAVRPKGVVISSAYDSQFGHPHETTLQRLAERSVPTYWTAVHGDIVLVSNGTAVTVQTQRDATTEPLALRDTPSIDPGVTDSVQTRRTITADGSLSPGTPTATGTPVATDGGTPSLIVSEIHADAEGDDREHLNDEYIVLKNTGDEPLDLTGWTVQDDAGHSYTLPNGVTLDAGGTVTLHTGSGDDTTTALYWGTLIGR